MAGTKHVGENILAVGAEVVPAAAVLAEYVPAELMGGRLSSRFAVELLER
jgi:hypothetical protein